MSSELASVFTLAPRGTVWSPARIERELAIVAQLPFFMLRSHSIIEGCLEVVGTLSFTQEETGKTQSLTIRLEYPREYPCAVPRIFDQHKQFEPSADGHQFPDYMLCLSFPERGEFRMGSEEMSTEVLGAALIWLDKRFIFERTKQWPGEAEEHGWGRPLRKLMLEEAARTRNKFIIAWINWVAMELVTPNYGGGCPCCSGRIFIRCHLRLAILVAQFLFWARYERELYGDRSTRKVA